MDEFTPVKLSFTRVLCGLIGCFYPRARLNNSCEEPQRQLKKVPSLFLLALIGSIASHTLASPEGEYNALSDQEVTGLITEWASLKPEQRRALLYEIRSRMALRRSSSIQNPDERELEQRSIPGRQYGRQNLVESPIILNKQSIEIRVRGIKNTGPVRPIDSKKYSRPEGVNSILSPMSDDKRLRAIKEGGFDYSETPIRFGSGFESRKRVKSGAQRDKSPSQKADDG
jgi:hypothetical protein